MSFSFVNSSVAAPKSACRNCGRNTRTVVIEGIPVALDTELIAVVVRGQKARAVAYRIHAELCEKYKLDAERERWREEQKAAAKEAKEAAVKAERVERLAPKPAPAPMPPKRRAHQGPPPLITDGR